MTNTNSDIDFDALRELLESTPESLLFDWDYLDAEGSGIQGVLRAQPTENSPAWFHLIFLQDTDGDWLPTAAVVDEDLEVMEAGVIEVAEDGETLSYHIRDLQNKLPESGQVFQEMATLVRMTQLVVQQWIMVPDSDAEDNESYTLIPEV